MIIYINWIDDRGNTRRDVVITTFLYEYAHFAVIAFNQFTVIRFNSLLTRSNVIDKPHYMELYE